MRPSQAALVEPCWQATLYKETLFTDRSASDQGNHSHAGMQDKIRTEKIPDFLSRADLVPLGRELPSDLELSEYRPRGAVPGSSRRWRFPLAFRGRGRR